MLKPTMKPTVPQRGSGEFRTPERYGVIRVIAGTICWLNKDRIYTDNPMNANLVTEREVAYETAQVMKGLLTVGTGLADLERGDR